MASDDARAAAARPAPAPVAGWELLGDSVTEVAPVPGRFAAMYDYAQSAYPTRERYVSRTIAGAAILELADDGTASACFGKRTARSSSVSRHASHDGKHHRNEDRDDRLVGARGTWTRADNAVRVSFDQLQRGACEVTEPTGSSLELRCVRLRRGGGPPTDVTACELTPWLGFDDLAINPGASPRAGPYTLQADPTGRAPSHDPGSPWLLFGDAPGMSLRFRDGRGDTRELELAERDVAFNEAAYRPLTP